MRVFLTSGLEILSVHNSGAFRFPRIWLWSTKSWRNGQSCLSRCSNRRVSRLPRRAQQMSPRMVPSCGLASGLPARTSFPFRGCRSFIRTCRPAYLTTQPRVRRSALSRYFTPEISQLERLKPMIWPVKCSLIRCYCNTLFAFLSSFIASFSFISYSWLICVE